MNKVFIILRKPNCLLIILPVLIFALIGVERAAAQDYQHTKDNLDQTLRSNARINPSTLAMELSIPIAGLPGRAGASMPLVFNYSSKVWELRATDVTFGPPNYAAEARPVYSDKAMAGWTSSYGIPKIDSTPELYDCNGNGASLLVQLPSGCANYNYAKKMRVTFPGGTTHELRKDDGLYNGNGNADKTGTYYAVDGSRVRLEWGSGGIATLFLPDGGRYFFDANEYCYRYIDRHGNVLEYNSTTGSWTDTLGRTLTAPIPFTSQGIQNQTEETQEFEVPGIGTTAREYELVWKKLSTTSTLADGYSFSYDASRCNPTVLRTPRLFDNTHLFKACSVLSGYFDPVVLTEIILPNGQKYKFAYNNYGEIARIDYPTGGYEKFVYEQIRAISWDYEANSYVAESYAQSNRGVTHRYVGAGDGATEQHWQYAVSYVSTVHGNNTYQILTTNPDGTSEKRWLHRSLNPVLGSEYGNYGFDTALAGMEIETQMFDSNGVLRSRQLFEWEVTTGTSPASNAVPQRDPRMKRQISLIFEPGETSALVQMSETVYEIPGQNGAPTDEAYFAALNAKQSKTYNYVVVSAATADDASLTTAVGWFSASSPAVITETDYLYDTNYKARNINGLVTETRVKDGAGVVKAKAQISYDESGYSLSSAGTLPTAAANSWIDPLTELGSTLGSKRGLTTSVKNWYDIANNQYIETHSYYDQYGNVRKTKDGNNKESEVQYSATYAFAYPTKTISAIPDTSGVNGSDEAFETTVVYDYNTGLPTSTTDANGQTTTMSYADPTTGVVDPLLRSRKVTAPNAHQTITEYGAGTSASTRFIKSRTQIDANNWKEGYSWYDGLGRAVKSQSVDSNGDVFVDTEYDQFGRPWKTTNPYRTGETVYKTENFYDAAGRSYKVKTPDNAEVLTAYSLATSGSQIGTVVTVTDQAGKQRRSITNGLGQLERVDEPNESNQLGTINTPNQPTNYSYDILNNLLTVNQGVQTRSFVYDSLSRLKSATNPESGTIQYQYDNNGNLTHKTDAREIETIYTYDALNRVVTRSYDGEPSGLETPNVTYTYDNLTNAKGKLIKVENSYSTTEYTEFDILGRAVKSRQTTEGTARDMEYVYNLSGALIEQKYPSGRVVKNLLDDDGMLSIVQSKKNATAGYWDYAKNFTYTAAGAVSSMQLGNGKWESTVFNSRLQPTQITLGTVQGGTDKLNLIFGYGTTNNNGNVLSQTITVPTVGTNNGFTAVQTYTYDSLNRLKSATEIIDSGSIPSWKQTYNYDRYGNRTFDEGSSGGQYLTTTLPRTCGTSPNFTVCPVDNPAASTTNNRLNGFTFDYAGNTQEDPGGREFTYDAENKQILVRDSSGNRIGEYFYDGDGKRVKKVEFSNDVATQTTIFIYDASGKIVAEYATNVEPVSTARVSYLTSDHLGSPRITTDKDGRVFSRRDFMPFGEEIKSDITSQRSIGLNYGEDQIRQKFTSYERDSETDLDFAQSRYFDSGFGRFSSPDNFLNDTTPAEPSSWNLYVYTRNNPLNFIDSMGEDIEIYEWNVDENGNGSYGQKLYYRGNKLYTRDGKEYEGTNDYALRVLSDLNQLKKDEPYIADIIRTLENSDERHQILFRKDSASADTDDPIAARQGLPTGSIMYYDPFKAKLNNGEVGPLRITLAHELSHSFDYDQGKMTPGERRPTQGVEIFDYKSGKVIKRPGGPANEVRARRVENRVRAALGFGPDLRYMGVIHPTDMERFLGDHEGMKNPIIFKLRNPIHK